MKIKLDDTFEIRSHYGTSVELVEKVISVRKKDNTEYENEKNLGYLPSVALALKKYIKLKAQEKDYEDVQEYYKELKHLAKEIIKVEEIFEILREEEEGIMK